MAEKALKIAILLNKFFVRRRRNRVWRKLREWLERYGPAEVTGTTVAVLGSAVAHKWTGNTVIAALTGSICESIGYYFVIISREFRKYSKGHPWPIARNLFLEFGPAEVLDSFATRPLFMGLGLHFLGQGWGLIAGKLAADFIFYVPTIIIYELRKK